MNSSTKLNNKIYKDSPIQLKKKNNLKPLLLTFLGTFIVFFFTFTVLLPIFTPNVDIPAFSDEHSMSSVTSNDFKGRIDPRLSEIEQEENAPAPKLKMEIPVSDALSQQQPVDTTNNTDSSSDSASYNVEPNVEPVEPKDSTSWDSGEYDYNYNPTNTQTDIPKPIINKGNRTSTLSTNPLKTASTQNVIPRPVPTTQSSDKMSKPVMAKVILGSYATPMQARLVSDTLIEMDLNVAPFIKEKDGRYILQVGSFSDAAKAEGLVQELQNKSFNAKVVYE